MKLYRAASGLIVEHEGRFFLSKTISFDRLIAGGDLSRQLQKLGPEWIPADATSLSDLRAPIGSQEVWAAGVTYYRSRTARMEESKSAAGGDFYDRVYQAERPELFFKATPSRVVGPREKVAVRDDSAWSVPEPELAVLINPAGKVVGYTVGNDMSCRDIEGENPLYLPQAKVYNRSCALGPGILVATDPLPSSTEIRLEIHRDGATAFSGTTTLAAMKRSVESLVKYLFSNNSFPDGCFLLTGTGIVPPDSFTLRAGDEIKITIDRIGTLVNWVG